MRNGERRRTLVGTDRTWDSQMALEDEVADRDVVLFLGAGFSADADLPVMDKFAEASKMERWDISKYATSVPPGRVMAPVFERAAQTYEAFRDLCVESGGISKRAARNIETVFCIAEALRSTGHGFLHLRGERLYIEEVIERIGLWIWKVYHQLPFFNTERRNPKPETYARFFELVSCPELRGRTTVITTNYDIVLEWQASEHDLAPVYPIASAEVGSKGV